MGDAFNLTSQYVANKKQCKCIEDAFRKQVWVDNIYAVAGMLPPLEREYTTILEAVWPTRTLLSTCLYRGGKETLEPRVLVAWWHVQETESLGCKLCAINELMPVSTDRVETQPVGCIKRNLMHAIFKCINGRVHKGKIRYIHACMLSVMSICQNDICNFIKFNLAIWYIPTSNDKLILVILCDDPHQVGIFHHWYSLSGRNQIRLVKG